jgi:streptomycin 6-kinase
MNNIFDAIIEKWQLSDLKPINSLSYIFTGFRNQQPIILKLGAAAEIIKEAEALKAYDGFGAIKVMAIDDEVILLERIIPGVTLKSYFPNNDNEAVYIAAKLMMGLHIANYDANKFPNIINWLKVFDDAWDIPSKYIVKAKYLRDKLLSEPGPQVLLHGDLHHDNILLKDKEWVVIDPKGVIGDPVFEIAAYVRNPMPELITENKYMTIITSRIEKFSQVLNQSKIRVKEACFVMAVYSWILSLEDGVDPEYFSKITDVMAEILVFDS